VHAPSSRPGAEIARYCGSFCAALRATTRRRRRSSSGLEGSVVATKSRISSESGGRQQTAARLAACVANLEHAGVRFGLPTAHIVVDELGPHAELANAA